MIETEISTILGYLMAAFAIGYTGGLILLVFKRAASSIFK